MSVFEYALAWKVRWILNVKNFLWKIFHCLSFRGKISEVESEHTKAFLNTVVKLRQFLSPYRPVIVMCTGVS